MAALSYATATTVQPHIQGFVHVPDKAHAAIRMTVTNNSPYPSPEGGMTLSFPAFDAPGDVDRIVEVVVPEGLALHVIPAGGQLYGRNGNSQAADYLMVEAYGPWDPQQSRTIQVMIERVAVPVAVQYRSALADTAGNYINTPAFSDQADQQGWPIHTCVVDSNAASSLVRR